MKNYKWPLNVNNFNFLDKLKICKFIIDPRNRWTQDRQVKLFESKFANFVGSKYAILVSSGSTANTLIAMYLKDHVSDKNIIVFPSTTWVTSISPFIREGFDPKFIDVSLDDLAMDLDKLEDYLAHNSQKVACIFLTSLLGFTPDIERLIDISEKYKVRIMMDNCENTFGSFKNKNISKFFTSTTSTYFGHQLQSIEGGFIFTDNEEEYNYFLMARNHGMVRSLPKNKEKYLNPLVDERFDFNILGNNFRNTDLNAFIGQIDFEKRYHYIQQRKRLYEVFKENLNESKFLIPKEFKGRNHIPFSLPIICKENYKKDIILKFCESNGIETRPIISGNLLRQTCFKHYDDFNNYPVSEYLTLNGLYVGLYSKLKDKQIKNLTSELNKL